MMKLGVVFLLLTAVGYSLEIDSKLTLRIVKMSKSQKTILINRGIEDGLAKNDHAKFFLTTGVVARGVAVKVSPTRSVWSLYRIINNGYIKPDQVLKLKITTALKVTKDESRSLIKDDQSLVVSNDPRDLGIPLAEGADDLTVEDKRELSESEAQELMAPIEKTTLVDPFEIGMIGTFINQSSTTKNGTQEFTGSDTSTTLGIYGEYYFTKMSGFLQKISIGFKFFNISSSTIAFQGSTSQEDIREYGGSVAYHLKETSLAGVINPYVDFAFLLGTVSSNFSLGENITGTKASVSGSTTAFAVGGGVKYFTSLGATFKAKMDYVSRSIDYEAVTVGASQYSKTQSGFRLFAGIGYRF